MNYSKEYLLRRNPVSERNFFLSKKKKKKRDLNYFPWQLMLLPVLCNSLDAVCVGISI